MPRIVTHKPLVNFHRGIAVAHKGINGFYRFNWNEINGQFRSGIGTPALLLESHSSELESLTKGKTNFNNRSVSFLLLDFAGKVNDFDGEDDVLDNTENIILDILAYLKKLSEDKDSWLYGLYDPNNVSYEKVGPIFDNMFGWNVIYTLKNHEKMCYDPERWDWA